MEISSPGNENASPGAALTTLRSGIEELRVVELAAAANWELRDTLLGLDAVIAQLEAQRARYLRDFDARHAYKDHDEAANPVAWLRGQCRMTGPAAAARVAVARWLPELPTARAAFEDGDISYQHAATLTRVIGDVGIEAAREHEDVLVDGARRYDPGFVHAVGRHLREYTDPDGALDAANDEHHRRYLHASPSLDGVVYIDGRLDSEGGALVMSALDSLMAPWRDDERNARQRRADALIELCRRQLDGGELPDRGGLRPHISLTVSIDKLRGDRTSPLGELEWTGSITTETARRIACDATVTTVIIDAHGLPVAIAPDRRVVPARLRRALVVRDGGCIGCGRPASWCDAHHIVHCVDGGETTLSNLGLLCRPCHIDVHEGRKRLERRPDGGWEIVGEQGGRRRVRRPPPISCAA